MANSDNFLTLEDSINSVPKDILNIIEKKIKDKSDLFSLIYLRLEKYLLISTFNYYFN